MFLGLDSAAEHVYFLTNRKYCNPKHRCSSVIEARLSSPPLVRKISFKDLGKLRSLQNSLKELEHEEFKSVSDADLDESP